MKKAMIALAFAVAAPMFAASQGAGQAAPQTNTPAATKPAKAKKVKKVKNRKKSSKKDNTTPAAK